VALRKITSCVPQIVSALRATPTAEGYNDGLSATSGASSDAGVPRVLSPERAVDAVFAEDEVRPIAGPEDFEERLGYAGRELLKQVWGGSGWDGEEGRGGAAFSFEPEDFEERLGYAGRDLLRQLRAYNMGGVQHWGADGVGRPA
jgi:hypothetical protein